MQFGRRHLATGCTHRRSQLKDYKPQNAQRPLCGEGRRARGPASLQCLLGTCSFSPFPGAPGRPPAGSAPRAGRGTAPRDWAASDARGGQGARGALAHVRRAARWPARRGVSVSREDPAPPCPRLPARLSACSRAAGRPGEPLAKHLRPRTCPTHLSAVLRPAPRPAQLAPGAQAPRGPRPGPAPASAPRRSRARRSAAEARAAGPRAAGPGPRGDDEQVPKVAVQTQGERPSLPAQTDPFPCGDRPSLSYRRHPPPPPLCAGSRDPCGGSRIPHPFLSRVLDPPALTRGPGCAFPLCPRPGRARLPAHPRPAWRPAHTSWSPTAARSGHPPTSSGSWKDISIPLPCTGGLPHSSARPRYPGPGMYLLAYLRTPEETLSPFPQVLEGTPFFLSPGPGRTPSTPSHCPGPAFPNQH